MNILVSVCPCVLQLIKLIVVKILEDTKDSRQRQQNCLQLVITIAGFFWTWWRSLMFLADRTATQYDRLSA